MHLRNSLNRGVSVNFKKDFMIKIILTITLISTVGLSCSAGQKGITSKLTLDYSGVDAFWEIVEKIVSENVTEKDWSYLFSTPYYSFYENWGQRKGIQRTLLLAFSPKKKLERDSLIRFSGSNSYILNHLLSAAANKTKLLAFKNDLVARDMANEILIKTEEFLPKDISSKTKSGPAIYFGIFQPDANASATSIAVDLNLCLSLTEPSALIAHEVHHFFVLSHRKKFIEIENDSTNLIMQSISQLQLEGLADLIDKEVFLQSNGKGFPPMLFETYSKAYLEPLINLNKIDSLFVAISLDPASSNQSSKLIFDLLTLGGHPHGFYMAKTILQVERKDVLLNTIRNQFDFIKAYNNASKKLNGRATFSKRSMTLLKQIENSHSL